MITLGRSAILRLSGIRRSFTSLPIIDISPLVQTEQDADKKAEVAAQLHAACKEVGFFYVTNHGVPENVYAGVLQQARAWFALPQSVKDEIAITPDRHYRGYQELGANVTRYDGGFQRDWHEAIDLYKEEDPEKMKARGLPYSAIHGPNQWPQQLPAFDAVLHQYIENMLGVGASIMRGIALGLGLPERFFEGDIAGDPYWCVRVIHYPPLAKGSYHQDNQGLEERAASAVHGEEVERSVQLSCGEHTDYGLLTLVNQENHIPALQVKNAEGQWITATPIPGAFVCNIGDMLKVWTNGLYRPTLHRVINADPAQSRVSIPFFYEPSFEAQIQPVEQLCGDKPAQWSATRYGSHLEKKVFSNFEL